MTPEQKQRAMQMLRRFSQTTPMTRTADNAAVAMAALLQELVDAPEVEPVARVTGYYGGYLSIATVDGMVLPAGTALYAAPPAPIVPDGWKLVPVDPTQEMMRSGANVPLNKAARHNAVYRAMLAAAPTPAPIVPEGWRLVPYTPTALMLERAEYAVNNRPQPSKYEPSATPAIIFWTAMLNYAPEAPTPAEAQADVARDAERLDWLDERNAPHGLGWEIIQMPAGNVHIHTLTGDKAKFGSIREAIDAAMSEKGGA